MATPKKTTGPKPKKGYKPNSTAFVSNDIKSPTTTRSRYTTTNDKGKRNYILTDTESYSPKDKSTSIKGKRYMASSIGKPTYETYSGKFSKNDSVEKIDFKKSMDTTGYAAGKKQFTVNSIKNKPGELSKTKSAKVNRSQVNPTLDKWKAAASKMKTGGAVKKVKKK